MELLASSLAKKMIVISAFDGFAKGLERGRVLYLLIETKVENNASLLVARK